MQRVHKYEITPSLISNLVSVRMPEGAEVLCVQVQQDEVCLWARVTDGNAHRVRHFRIAGTGHELDCNVGRYIGTVQLKGGALVLHVFEEPPQ